MPKEKGKEHQAELACEICLKEIDREEGETYEVDDYVHHFCGLGCYAKWQNKKAPDGKDEK